MRRLVIAAAIAACKSREPSPTKQAPAIEQAAVKAPPTVASPGPAGARGNPEGSAESIEAPSEMAPALMPLAWLRGDWTRDGASLHWRAAGGALYGVRFDDAHTFDVSIIDDVDAKIELFSLGAGAPPHEAILIKQEGRTASFAGHDGPMRVYALNDDNKLTIGDVAYASAQSPSRAPELETADRAFSADVGARGVAGWLAAFEPEGSMISRGKKVSGADMGASMKPLLESGTLAWAPVASGMHGDLGFTVGTATFTGKTAADSWKSSYVTIWAKQPDGSWKVRFDTGRPI